MSKLCHFSISDHFLTEMWKLTFLILSCVHAQNNTNEVDLWIADPDGPEHIRFTWNLTSNVFQQKSIPLETNDYFEVSRHYMCSYMLKNVIYLIGGADESANKTEWDLFRRRQCVNYNGDSAIACNGGDDDEGLSRECYVTSNGVKYSPVGNLLGDHFRGSLTGYNSSALMIGGINSTQGTIEFLHKNKWTIVASDKRLSNLWDAMPITLNGSIYLFGGFKCEKYTKEDPCTTNPSYNWDVLMIDVKALKIKLHPQKLQTERWFARSILADNKIIHVGGDSDDDYQPLECWQPRKDGNFTITVSKPALDGWSIWPFVFNWADFVKTGSG